MRFVVQLNADACQKRNKTSERYNNKSKVWKNDVWRSVFTAKCTTATNTLNNFRVAWHFVYPFWLVLYFQYTGLTVNSMELCNFISECWNSPKVRQFQQMQVVENDIELIRVQWTSTKILFNICYALNLTLNAWNYGFRQKARTRAI